MGSNNERALSYDDVLLLPRYSEVVSRSDISTMTKLGRGLHLSLPVLSSPMDTISESSMGVAMQRAGGAGVIHR